MRLIAIALLSAACSGTPTKTFTITVSGEEGATGTTTTADGWELRYEHVLVTVADPSLSENPDKSPTDQSQTGSLVEKLAGTFAVDLAIAGPLAMPSKQSPWNGHTPGNVSPSRRGTETCPASGWTSPCSVWPATMAPPPMPVPMVK